MSESTHKAWKKPELIIIVRNHPQETVLLSCKTGELHMPGPAGNECIQNNGNGCHMRQSS